MSFHPRPPVEPFSDLIRELFANYGMTFRETRMRGRPVYQFIETDMDGSRWHRDFTTREALGEHAIDRLRDEAPACDMRPRSDARREMQEAG